MKSYPEAIRFLYALQGRGMKFGLRGIRWLLKEIGNPEHRLACIHIAGSNGKGSTAAMIAAALTASGYRTGLYTSPHLVDFRERIRIDGKPISPRTILRFCRKMGRMIEAKSITFFEAVTALALQYFAEQKVDIAVIETGLGGRLDATNAIRPVLSVITSISLEHTQFLGNSLSEIAYEKAGIVKRGIPCVTAVRPREALETIRDTCRKRGSELIETANVGLKIHTRNLVGTTLSFEVGGRQWSRLKLDLPGTFQAGNAVTALASLQQLSDQGWVISPRAVRKGLGSVSRLTGLRGRLSKHGSRPLVLMDVAHNPGAAERLVASLKELGVRKVVLVFGVMRDKEFGSMIRSLSDVTSVAVVVKPKTSRAAPVVELEKSFHHFRIPVRAASSVKNGLRMAYDSAGRQGTILVTGSHFVVGEAIAALEGKKYLTINQ